jgi:hypothetical protein
MPVRTAIDGRTCVAGVRRGTLATRAVIGSGDTENLAVTAWGISETRAVRIAVLLDSLI